MILSSMDNKTALIVLYYNKFNQTKKCIESILSSGYTDKDIFVFDNGSKEAVFTDLRELYPQINHKRNEINRGYSGGFNNSVKWAFKSGYNSVLFLTNDTRIKKDTLTEVLKTAERTRAEIIAPTIYYLFKQTLIDSFGGYFNPENATLHHYKNNKGSELLDGKWDYIPGTALWLTKSAFFKLEGMDENYHTYWEDVDFSFRARKSHVILARSINAKILHGVGKTCHKKPEYTTFYFHRNRIKFCKKYLSEILLKKSLNFIEDELNKSKKKLSLKGDKKRLNYIETVMNELKDG